MTQTLPQTVSFSAFVARWSEMRGKVASPLHKRIGREAALRATPVAFRAAPLDFSDLAAALEEGLAA